MEYGLILRYHKGVRKSKEMTLLPGGTLPAGQDIRQSIHRKKHGGD